MNDGLLVVDKPQGISSHDVVARGRRAIGTRAIGHAGTLDPMATGVLVLCINKATRLSEYLLGEDKTYIGVIRLGQRTNTDDAEGEVLEERPVNVTADALALAALQFSGPIMQVPPQFSAIKRDGQRAYALARKGESVELAARPTVIHHIELKRLSENSVQIDVMCKAGTYVRALARDIGETLGCGGHLSALRRIQAGQFNLSQALSLERLSEWQAHLLPMDQAVKQFPAIHLDEHRTRALKMGQALSGLTLLQDGLCRVYDANGAFMAIGQMSGQVLKPVKVFVA